MVNDGSLLYAGELIHTLQGLMWMACTEASGRRLIQLGSEVPTHNLLISRGHVMC